MNKYYTQEKITYNDALKELRIICKKQGLVFKKQNNYINSKQAFKMTDRKTGLTVSKNWTFWSAYENLVCGDITRKDLEYEDLHNDDITRKDSES